MIDDIQKLIASLRLGDHADPTERIGLLTAALIEHNADLALLLNLLRAPQLSLRLAAVDASRERTEGAILAELLRLADDAEPRVRQKIAEILVTRADPAATEALINLAGDSESNVRMAAMKSTRGRSEFRALQEMLLGNDQDSEVRLAAAEALDSQSDPEVVRAFAAALLRGDDWELWRRCAEVVERHLRERHIETEKQMPSDISDLTNIGELLKHHNVQRLPLLDNWLKSQMASKVDPAALERFGTDLTALAQKGTLPQAYFVEEACETVLKLLRQTPTRSIALLGPAGVGKSSLVHRLTYRLAQPDYGWRVVRVSPSDFLTNTKYVGEWETKVRELIDAIRAPRRVLLYIPKLSDLAGAGTTSKSDSNVATALAPYLDDGSVVVLGESTLEEFERGLGKIPSLRRLFDQVLLLEPDLARTSNVLAAIRDEESSRISDELLQQILEVSSQFLSHISRPGNAVELLRAAIKSERNSGRVLSFRDILDALSRSTGIPANVLDDSIPLKYEETQSFFESKIVGQPRAVEAVVDLVTLIKAGVTDPSRPFGVFMFVGPTGVGKTELARALAEFIFGDAARLKRFDMSEFANPEGFTRLIGSQTENGLLTDAIRQQPFSVVLLDEIEKAHINVFDLCLQLFDAGRLTDGRGRTVDFRRTIIILTSNVGATTGLLGFGSADSERGSKAPKDKMPTELSRFFRPEFLNRLDRIIQFGPLSLEVAEQIARKEIHSVLQRSGIRRRELVVEVDASVVSLVVKEGYSARFGARPLKRTVERLLLLPVAKAISSGSLQKNSVLRLSVQSGRIKIATVTLPEPRTAPEKLSKTQLAASERLADLRSRYGRLTDSIEAMAARKSELIRQTHAPSFSSDAEVRTSVLSDIHSVDEFLNLYETVGNSLRSAGNATRREEMERLQQEVDHLEFVARCKDSRSLGDALVTVTLVKRTGAPQESIRKIAGMYQALATRRRLNAEVLGESYSPEHDRAYILISGLGAYGLFMTEAGLHQVNRRYKQRATRGGREVLRDDRELVRVEVSPAPHEPSAQFHRQVKARLAPLKPTRKRLVTAEFALSLFHEPTLRSADLWTPGPKDAAVARGLLILSAAAESNGEAQAVEGIIRQYDLGLAAKIRDTRTGRVTTRVAQVLKGDLDVLLTIEK